MGLATENKNRKGHVRPVANCGAAQGWSQHSGAVAVNFQLWLYQQVQLGLEHGLNKQCLG